MAERAIKDSEWPSLNEVAGNNLTSHSTDTRSDSFRQNNTTKKGSKKKKPNWNRVEIEIPSYRENRNFSASGRSTDTKSHYDNRNYNAPNRRGHRGRNGRRTGHYNGQIYQDYNPYQQFQPFPVAETVVVNNDITLTHFKGMSLSDVGVDVEIQNHLEYVMSDNNLVKDHFFRKRIDKLGLVPIATFLGCPKMTVFNANLMRLMAAAQKSNKVELINHFVRRIVDPVKWLQRDEDVILEYDEFKYTLSDDGFWAIHSKNSSVPFSTSSMVDSPLEGATCSAVSDIAPLVCSVVDPQFHSANSMVNRSLEGATCSVVTDTLPFVCSVVDPQLDSQTVQENDIDSSVCNGADPKFDSKTVQENGKDSSVCNGADPKFDSKTVQENGKDSSVCNGADSQNGNASMNGTANLQLEDSEVCERVVQLEQPIAATLVDSMANLLLEGAKFADVNGATELTDDMPTVMLEDFDYVNGHSTGPSRPSRDIPGSGKSKGKVPPVTEYVYFKHQGQTNCILPINGYDSPYENVSSIYYPEDLCTAVSSNDCTLHMSPEPLR